MPIGSERIAEGLERSYDDGTSGVEVVHKASTGFAYVVNVTVYGGAYLKGAVFEIRDGTGAGNTVWRLDISADLFEIASFAFPVNLAALFNTDIRTLITPGAGRMTVAYQ